MEEPKTQTIEVEGKVIYNDYVRPWENFNDLIERESWKEYRVIVVEVKDE